MPSLTLGQMLLEGGGGGYSIRKTFAWGPEDSPLHVSLLCICYTRYVFVLCEV